MNNRLREALAGGQVVDDLLTLVEHEGQAPDKGRGVERLALQIVGAELLGYAGVELGGFTRYDELCRVFDAVGGLRAHGVSEDDWWRRWQEHARLPTGEPARLLPDPGFFIFDRGGRVGARAPQARGGSSWLEHFSGRAQRRQRREGS